MVDARQMCYLTYVHLDLQKLAHAAQPWTSINKVHFSIMTFKELSCPSGRHRRRAVL